jgi:MFS transporter, DHA1 family, tetracycline resistance protein
LRSSPLLPIFLIVAVDVLGLTIMIPLLPFYAEKMGASPSTVGLLIGTYAACQLISGPLLGRASDFTGRKPLLLLSQVGTLIGFLILAFAPNLWIVFLARVIDGSTAGNLSLAQAYISDVTQPEDRAKSFGVIGIAFGMGFLIGPAISGFLSQFSYRDPIFAAAGLSATSILATYFLLPGAIRKSHTPVVAASGGRDSTSAASTGPAGRRLSLLQWGEYARYFRDPALATRLWQFLAFGFAFAMFTAGFPLFAERRLAWHGVPFGPKQVGYAWAYAGFLGIFLQGPALGKMVKKFGERALNRVGFAAYSAGYATLGFCFSIPVLIVATTISAIGTLVRPTLTSLITQATPREEQGVVLGLTQSLTSVAQIAGPPLAGFLIQRGMLTGWGLTASGVALIGFLLATRPTSRDQAALAPGERL